jgi:hypothetical protein
MPKHSTKNLYQKIVDISQDYLGPAADRFITRQINTHLNKAPEQLDEADLRILIDWIKPTFALLTNDTKLVNSFIDRLLALTGQPSKRMDAHEDS